MARTSGMRFAVAAVLVAVSGWALTDYSYWMRAHASTDGVSYLLQPFSANAEQSAGLFLIAVLLSQCLALALVAKSLTKSKYLSALSGTARYPAAFLFCIGGMLIAADLLTLLKA